MSTMSTLSITAKTDASSLSHLVYMPEEFEKQGVKKPLLVFLHGRGERGNGSKADLLSKVPLHGPFKHIHNKTWDSALPFVVIAPQLCKTRKEWNPKKINRLIKYAVKHYNVDPKSVYMTGLSMGG